MNETSEDSSEENKPTKHAFDHEDQTLKSRPSPVISKKHLKIQGEENNDTKCALDPRLDF